MSETHIGDKGIGEPGHRRLEGSSTEVLQAFLTLGVTSFGGPVAHLGYFRQEFVLRRRWMDERAFADLVSLCQFLPGPASSQVAFAIGLMRAGYRGALAAWTGFTLPSAILLVLFSYSTRALHNRVGAGLLHGLELVAVAIVAQAVWGMARMLCQGRARASIAVGATLVLLFSTSSVAQLLVICGGGTAGYLFCRLPSGTPATSLAAPVSQRAGIVALFVFALPLAILPLLRAFPSLPGSVALFEAFYRSGALVFGGGHVVLPLLREAFVHPGWVSNDTFLAGYGAAQAVPGPLFTFAAYLGAVAKIEPHGFAGAVVGLLGIFLPGMLILIGALPFWAAFRTMTGAQTVMAGVNAAVVGVLGAALYQSLWLSAVRSSRDFGVALACFVLLTAWQAPPVLIVALGAVGGVAFSFLP